MKSQVESFRKRPAQKVKAEPIDNTKLEGMDRDEAAEKVHALQQYILYDHANRAYKLTRTIEQSICFGALDKRP